MAADDGRKKRWADLEDDDDDFDNGLVKGKYEPEKITGPDADGWYTRTRHFIQNGWVMRSTDKFKKYTTVQKQYKVTAERKKWQKFGQASSQGDQVTTRANEEVKFDNLVQREAPTAKKAQASMRLAALSRPGFGEDGGDEMPGESEEQLYWKERKTELEAKASKGTFVPSRLFAAADGQPGARQMQEGGTIRVYNLSNDADEEELRALFNTVNKQRAPIRKFKYQAHKGVAYVTYLNHGDAVKAAEEFDGMPFEYLVMSVELLPDG